MPPKGHFSRLVCAFEGCSNPPHVYPSGTKAKYCADHIHLRKGLRRKQMPSMTEPMRQIAAYLYRQNPHFVRLPKGIDPRTLPALLERNWLTSKELPGGCYYRLSELGLRAYKIYAEQGNRRDGICPRCHTQPRHVRKSGAVDAYCLDCQHEIRERKKKLGIVYENPDRKCSRCKTEPLYRYPSGKLSTYCKACGEWTRRENARKERARLLELALAGDPLPVCQRCHEKPRHFAGKTVYKYCLDCQRTLVWRKAEPA